MADQWSQSIAAPGLDLVYEGMHRYGASLTLFGSLILFAWMLWTLDYSMPGR